MLVEQDRGCGAGRVGWRELGLGGRGLMGLMGPIGAIGLISLIGAISDVP